MKNDTKRALELLRSNNHTCVLCKDGQTLTDDHRGIQPLLKLLGRDLNGFCAADKVVGKAAALLYRLMGIAEIHAGIISEPAIQVLEDGGICVFYETKVTAIRNRANTGFCPMETAVWNIDSPEAAPDILRHTLANLK